MKNIRAKVIFSSILPVYGKSEARKRHIIHINSWLHGWCHCEGLEFYDNGTFYEDYNLLRSNGIHISRRGRAILGNRLANLSEAHFKLKELGVGSVRAMHMPLQLTGECTKTTERVINFLSSLAPSHDKRQKRPATWKVSMPTWNLHLSL